MGATAIEDKLQDGVPDTIANLAKVIIIVVVVIVVIVIVVVIIDRLI